jgi:hypothetical protein
MGEVAVSQPSDSQRMPISAGNRPALVYSALDLGLAMAKRTDCG